MVFGDNEKRFCNLIEQVEDKEPIKKNVSDEEKPILEDHESFGDKKTLAYVEDDEEVKCGPTFLFEGLEAIDLCSVCKMREEKPCNIIISGKDESSKDEDDHKEMHALI